MAIVNRDLDSSQQVVNASETINNVVTGATYTVTVVSQPAQLVGAGVACKGLSGAPNLSLWIHRFIAGSGFTSIAVGASMVAWAFGTSGGQTFNVGGGVTYNLMAGDVVALSTAAANTAAESINVSLAMKALQDIKTQFGASV